MTGDDRDDFQPKKRFRLLSGRAQKGDTTTEGSGGTLPDLDGPTGPGTSPGTPARLPTPVPGTSGATNKRPVPTTGTQLSR